MTMALNLKLTRPVPDMDAYVSRLLAAEHHEHRVARPLCPLCPGGVRRYREVVPPREREELGTTPYGSGSGWSYSRPTWLWFDSVRSRPGEWVTVERRETSNAARSMAKRWKSREVAGLSIRTRGCEIHARWSGG